MDSNIGGRYGDIGSWDPTGSSRQQLPVGVSLAVSDDGTVIYVSIGTFHGRFNGTAAIFAIDAKAGAEGPVLDVAKSLMWVHRQANNPRRLFRGRTLKPVKLPTVTLSNANGQIYLTTDAGVMSLRAGGRATEAASARHTEVYLRARQIEGTIRSCEQRCEGPVLGASTTTTTLSEAERELERLKKGLKSARDSYNANRCDQALAALALHQKKSPAPYAAIQKSGVEPTGVGLSRWPYWRGIPCSFTKAQGCKISGPVPVGCTKAQGCIISGRDIDQCKAYKKYCDENQKKLELAQQAVDAQEAERELAGLKREMKDATDRYDANQCKQALAALALHQKTSPGASYRTGIPCSHTKRQGCMINATQLDLCQELEQSIDNIQRKLDAAEEEADAGDGIDTLPIIILASVGGAIVLYTALHFATCMPGVKDKLDLYLLVTGGLLDALSDALYITFEAFDDETLRIAATTVITLPLVVVFLGFWAGMAINYEGKRWRLVFAVFEGTLAMITVACVTAVTWAAEVARACLHGLFGEKRAEGDAARKLWIYEQDGYLRLLRDFTWYRVTRKIPGYVLDPETKENVPLPEEDFKFYQLGLAQAIIAFVLTPLGLAVGTIVGSACTVVATVLAAASAVCLALVLPASFAVMALLRLFVMWPAAWKVLCDASCWFAMSADEALPFGFFPLGREVDVRQNMFNIWETRNRDTVPSGEALGNEGLDAELPSAAAAARAVANAIAGTAAEPLQHTAINGTPGVSGSRPGVDYRLQDGTYANRAAPTAAEIQARGTPAAASCRPAL